MNSINQVQSRISTVEPAGIVCVIRRQSASTDEADCKFEARVLLASIAKQGILVPSYDEWVGVGLLERDGGLTRR